MVITPHFRHPSFYKRSERDGTKVLAAGYDHTIHVWDSSIGTKINSINKSSDAGMISVDNLFTNFSADGSSLAYSSDSSEGPMLFPVAGGQTSKST
jgi:WD40 repeat protein